MTRRKQNYPKRLKCKYIFFFFACARGFVRQAAARLAVLVVLWVKCRLHLTDDHHADVSRSPCLSTRSSRRVHTESRQSQLALWKPLGSRLAVFGRKVRIWQRKLWRAVSQRPSWKRPHREREGAEPDHLLFVLETSIKAFIAKCQSAVRRPLWSLHNQSGQPSVTRRVYCKCICSAEQTKPAGPGLTVCEIYWLTLALDGVIR